jgi:hypothetical protein
MKPLRYSPNFIVANVANVANICANPTIRTVVSQRVISQRVISQRPGRPQKRRPNVGRLLFPLCFNSRAS